MRCTCRRSRGACCLKWPVFWERLGLVLWPAFSGVLMVEASKQIYAGVPVKEVRGFRRRVGAGARRRHRQWDGLPGQSPGKEGCATRNEHQRDNRNTACSPNRFCMNSGMETPSFEP